MSGQLSYLGIPEFIVGTCLAMNAEHTNPISNPVLTKKPCVQVVWLTCQPRQGYT